MKLRPFFLFLIVAAFYACDSTSGRSEGSKAVTLKEHPVSNADSLFAFVKTQVDFGPRIPNTEAHKKTASWLKHKFESFGAKVQFQEWEDYVYDGTKVDLKNIIATINPQAKKRIMLSAHWDTRPFADHDTEDKYLQLDGANDGASGVAVLLELARIISENELSIGVDFILFDGEDWGEHKEEGPTSLRDGLESWWCLGSQYWSKNKHIPNYTAYYGILLDMVGAKDARFPYEKVSKQFAARILDKVWSTAHELGYQDSFVKVDGPEITDDHVFVNSIANIPMIDIIDLRTDGTNIFTPVWHTQYDNLENIDKTTLEMVANVLLAVLWNE